MHLVIQRINLVLVGTKGGTGMSLVGFMCRISMRVDDGKKDERLLAIRMKARIVVGKEGRCCLVVVGKGGKSLLGGLGSELRLS